MNKIPLIIKREYLTRVKKKSFIIMTFVGPILMAAIFIFPIWFATMEDGDTKTIGVCDKSGLYKDIFKDTESIKYAFVSQVDLDTVKKDFEDSGYYAFLNIPDTAGKSNITLYSDKQPSISVTEKIEGTIESYIEDKNLKKLGIKKEDIESIKEDIKINTIKWTEDGDVKSSSEMTMIIGFLSAIIIYMFIFIYGAQVMRGVIEEKTSRVVEVIISSVKPFQLMAGKIIGIAMVALTQVLLWGILTAAIIVPVQSIFLSDVETSQNIIPENSGISNELTQASSNSSVNEIIETLGSYNWGLLGITFIFFFIGGYLLYAALFAAIGSAVDNETDTQQFMVPVTVPLILAFIAAQAIIKNPDGQLAFWFSIIPFTSPIIMPIRIAFNSAESWEIILSVVLLIGGFFGTVWLAAKIYRTGILMYGKKVSYKELWKWLRHS